MLLCCTLKNVSYDITKYYTFEFDISVFGCTAYSMSRSMHNGKNILSHIYYCFKPVDVFLQERCGATLLAISFAIYCFIPIQVRVLH